MRILLTDICFPKQFLVSCATLAHGVKSALVPSFYSTTLRHSFHLPYGYICCLRYGKFTFTSANLVNPHGFSFIMDHVKWQKEMLSGSIIANSQVCICIFMEHAEYMCIYRNFVGGMRKVDREGRDLHISLWSSYIRLVLLHASKLLQRRRLTVEEHFQFRDFPSGELMFSKSVIAHWACFSSFSRKRQH